MVQVGAAAVKLLARQPQPGFQLDAFFFHLYGLNRDEAAEILDTFLIVRRQDEARWGRFRMRELIVASWNAHAAGNVAA